MNFEGDMFIDGKWIGRTEGIAIHLCDGRLITCAGSLADEWPDTVLEDVLDADLVD